MKQNAEALIADLKNRTQSIKDKSESTFKVLTADQLNWKPNPEKWSIGECLEHLSLYGDYYIPAIGEAIKNGANKKAVDEFKAGWLGNYFANSMLPKEGAVTNKMKTLKDKNPAFSTLPKDVVDRFIDQQIRMIELLDSAKAVNLMTIRVPISIGKFIKLKLGDTFRFIIYHNERHIVQAKNVHREMIKSGV